MPRQEIQLYRYFFTLFDDDLEDEERRKRLISNLQEHAKDWAFQLERCPTTGKLHYQGRIKFGKKLRPKQVREELSEPKIHLEAERNEEGSEKYCEKEETRVAGPWKPPVKMPWQLQCVSELRPWQAALLKKLETRTPRTINVLIDAAGGIGKTTFALWCEVQKKASIIPPMNSMEDLMQCVMDMPKASAYIIDMPRALPKSSLHGLWAAIEQIKNGFAYDKRYHFKKEIFDAPEILVFSNKEPEWDNLTPGRWDAWQIGYEDDLVAYAPNHQ